METDPGTTNSPQPPRDLSLLPPLLIGILSLLGICAIFVAARSPEQNTPQVPTDSPTPYQYVFLGTETLIPTPEEEQTSAAPDTLLVPQPGNDEIPSPDITAQNETVTPDPLLTPVTMTPNPIFSEAEPMTAGTYDDLDPEIILTGNWTIEASADAYQQSVLVSDTPGNSFAFSFVGRQVIVGFLDIHNGGTMVINLDGAEESILQAGSLEWISPELDSGLHYVTVKHDSGEMITLDYVDVVE